jgi:hypothetical protein
MIASYLSFMPQPIGWHSLQGTGRTISLAAELKVKPGFPAVSDGVAPYPAIGRQSIPKKSQAGL